MSADSVGGRDEADVELARCKLNQTYDRFASRQFGPLSDRVNSQAFRGDPDRPLLFSLENYDSESKKATKTAIFRERTIHRQRPVESVDSPKAALIVSLNEKAGLTCRTWLVCLVGPPRNFYQN